MMMTKDSAQRMSLAVVGMSCGSCVGKIEAALAPIAGISEVEVALADGQVSFSKHTSTLLSTVVEAIEQAGYHADVPMHHFRVEGMTCGKCEADAVQALQHIAGVQEAVADRHHNSLTVLGQIGRASCRERGVRSEVEVGGRT